MSAKQAVKISKTDQVGVELYAYSARRDGRKVVDLRAIRYEDGVTVEATVYPIGSGEELDRPHTFADEEHARRYVEEALTALEYLDCVVVD